MKNITRRNFIKLTSASAVAVAHSMSTFEFAHAAGPRPLPAGTPILVIVTLSGGNDGLNTVVPYLDPLYKSLRPQLAYKEDQVLPIGDGLALNGSMTGFKTLWDNKQLAIVRGVGYPNPDRSHFSSMAIWQSASRTPIKTGWIGRWIETQPENPFLAISLGSTMPALFQGDKRSGTVLPLSGLVTPTGMLAKDYAKTSKKTKLDGQLSATAARSIRDLFTVADVVSPILKNPAPPAADLPTVIGGNAGGESNLGAQLDVAAKLIAAGVPTRVWSVSLGGFDTHANELSAQSLLLGSVSNSISKFMSQMRTIGRSRDVTIMVYSEFGRRVSANASSGTDHGTSGPVFIIGERVVGGFHGDQPPLNRLKDGDLAVTTDFRSVYGSVLEGVLYTPVDRVISGWNDRLALFTA
ncbi:unannotated protein [freshwater metagenome]|uniref:Unannotated protein n=1 Tax=freshwater metagenome TaxID=449393 RepID=A0A6J6ML09_9ZZZZ|nr:DUF1501 domain-containing protein [Actinomycetota bacterium]